MSLIESIMGFFRKKQKLRAYFIDEVGTVTKKVVKYKNNTFEANIQGEKGAYLIDHNNIFYDRKDRMASSFYHTNNPQPLKLNHNRNEEGIDSVGFKSVLDSKTIKDLFSSEGINQLTILLYIAIAIVIMQVISLAHQFGLLKVVGAT